jgi:hypothetical protein
MNTWVDCSFALDCQEGPGSPFFFRFRCNLDATQKCVAFESFEPENGVPKQKFSFYPKSEMESRKFAKIFHEAARCFEVIAENFYNEEVRKHGVIPEPWEIAMEMPQNDTEIIKQHLMGGGIANCKR